MGTDFILVPSNRGPKPAPPFKKRSDGKLADLDRAPLWTLRLWLYWWRFAAVMGALGGLVTMVLSVVMLFAIVISPFWPGPFDWWSSMYWRVVGGPLNLYISWLNSKG